MLVAVFTPPVKGISLIFILIVMVIQALLIMFDTRMLHPRGGLRYIGFYPARKFFRRAASDFRALPDYPKLGSAQ
jgi:hypothetical protein